MAKAKSNRNRIPSRLLFATQANTYECDSGHWLTSPNTYVRCPAMVKGKPCGDILRSEASARARETRLRKTGPQG